MMRTALRRRKPRPRGRWRLFWDAALAAAILALVFALTQRLDRVESRLLSGNAVVGDGDSLTLGGERIRLRGIDAPELAQTCRRDGAGYPCGRLARAALAELVGAEPVTCRGWERDRYGRLLAVCEAGGRELNRAMVERGWAVAYGDYGIAEAAARQAGEGLWAGSFEAPRDWRAVHGSLAEAEHDALGRVVNWLRALLGISSAPQTGTEEDG